jgi:hypothetical protein
MAGASRSETKRRYGREYMRRWRSRSKNRLRERLNRERWHWLRKVRAAGYGGPGSSVKTGRQREPASAVAPLGGRRKEASHLAGASDKSSVKACGGAMSKSFVFVQDERERPFGSGQGKQGKAFGRPQYRDVSSLLRQPGRHSSGRETKASGQAAHNLHGLEWAHRGQDLSRRRQARGRSARQAGMIDMGGKSKVGVGPLRYTFRNARGKLVCGFCRYRAPVREVVRLRVDERVPGGYVKIRVPYCGEC